MENKNRRLPKILRINRVDKNKLCLSVLFSDGKDRVLDFARIFGTVWAIKKGDPEYKLLAPAEFAKVELANHTMTGPNGKKIKAPYDIGADTLYELSEPDDELSVSIGSLFRTARQKAKLSQ